VSGALGLFAAHGIELEYMIVGRDRLDVLPLADRLLLALGASPEEGEVELDAEVAASNELCLHVFELKTAGPRPSLLGLDLALGRALARVRGLLAPWGARLMPTAMHPWMDPGREARLWPHGNAEVYAAFDRVFGARGHGFANLQSMHLNLPFAGVDEFGRLHAAVRAVLPLLPALAASSPFAGGADTGNADHRLEVYRTNSSRVPSVTGQVVPEPVYDRATYERQVLGRMYADVAPLDPEGTLRHEWLNARGAIARFDRSAIEVRVLDVQECPAADLAIAGAVTACLRALVDERWVGMPELMGLEVEPLAAALRRTVRLGERAVIDEPGLLRAFGLERAAKLTAGELWGEIVSRTLEAGSEVQRQPLDVILRQGTLATRIRRALGGAARPARAELEQVYAALCDCLDRGQSFAP
jgi:gamma-glutamyl:cysteine ligase YbdK (ATP-grasp superfamily)